jgi:hypothetical protein
MELKGINEIEAGEGGRRQRGSEMISRSCTRVKTAGRKNCSRIVKSFWNVLRPYTQIGAAEMADGGTYLERASTK